MSPCPLFCLSQAGTAWKRVEGNHKVSAKNKSTPLWKFVPNFGLHGKSTVASLVNLARRPSPVYHTKTCQQKEPKNTGHKEASKDFLIHTIVIKFTRITGGDRKRP